jgi:hypothetical protein
MTLEDCLSYELIDAQPRRFDFTEGYSTRWEIPLDLTDEEWEHETYVPIYNVFYLLGADFKVPRDFRSRLNNMTIVRTDDEHGLALTGCGMDYTWEICETYLNLGYYPPVAMCRLPRMAGRGTSAGDRRIIDGCLQSLDAMLTQHQWTYDHLRQTYR